MITFLTGGPGTGKTAFLISQLLEIKKAQPYREFFIHGIRDFTGFPHTTIYCKSPLCDLCQSAEVPDGSFYVEEYPRWFKAHFLIVVDEVQRIWPVKMLAASIDAVSRLQTHRHYGLDFWIVSQSPKLVHTDVKAMIGRHIHLVAKWSGRKQFEWPEVRDNINARTDSVERPYKLPKQVFSMYSSAEVHTVQEKRVPLSLYATAIALIVAVGVGLAVTSRIKNRIAPPLVSAADVPASKPGTTVNDANVVPIPVVENPQTNLLVSFTPRIEGVPWSAPYYDELTKKPSSFPQIKGCIKGIKKNVFKCDCYTQQATVVDVPLAVCLSYVEHHAFNPFLRDRDAYDDRKQANDNEDAKLGNGIGQLAKN